jgi:hypothetical protein
MSPGRGEEQSERRFTDLRDVYTVHPHKALGYRSPREFRKQWIKKTTENLVGAWRRPDDSTMSADAIGSSPSAAHRAETRSVWLDAGAAVDHS